MSNVTFIVLDNTRGASLSYKKPTDEHVYELFNKLNGVQFSELIIEIVQGEKYMSVGGGKDNAFICSIQDGDEIHLLTNGTNDSDFTEIMCGQKSEYPNNLVIGRDDVLTAITDYLASNMPSQSLVWDVI